MIVEEKFETAKDFLEELQISKARWISEQNSWECSWIFRGQPDSNLKLIPSAWRISNLEPLRQKYKAKFEQKRLERLKHEQEITNKQIENGELAASEGEKRFNEISNNIKRIWELGLYYFAEIQAVKEFIEFADRLGYPVSGVDEFVIGTGFRNYKGLPDDEFLINKCLMLTTHNNPFNVNSSAVALAQHHGVPTRLLDWTENPLIAAFFAADEFRSYKYAEDSTLLPERRIAIWALSKEKCSNSEPDVYTPSPIQLITRPRHDIAYLFAQKGVFTADKSANDWFLRKGTWLSLEDAIDNNPDYLKKLTLPISEIRELLRLLWLQNISRAHLMPTLDNVTRALQARSSWGNDD